MSSRSSAFRSGDGRLWLPIRLVWNADERRPRSPVRLVVGIGMIFLFAALGSQFRSEPIAGGGPGIEAANKLIWVLPQAVCIGFGVVLACLLIDRRRLTDLGLDFDRIWWRGLAGGTMLGAGIVITSVVIGLSGDYIEVSGTRLIGGPVVWLLLAVAAAGFQLLYIVPEELFVRGYVITNVTEGLDGVPSVPRGVAAGVGVAVASLLFYVTHSGRGFLFGVMAAGLAVLLGVGYVLNGDLSVPIGIHFGLNFAGVLTGTNAGPASLLRVGATGTIAENLALPVEVVAARLVGAVFGIALLVWWYRATAGRIRVVPTIARPTLRWRQGSDTVNE